MGLHGDVRRLEVALGADGVLHGAQGSGELLGGAAAVADQEGRVVAFLDVNANGVREATEPFDTAAATWADLTPPTLTLPENMGIVALGWMFWVRAIVRRRRYLPPIIRLY